MGSKFNSLEDKKVYVMISRKSKLKKIKVIKKITQYYIIKLYLLYYKFLFITYILY